MPMIDYLILIPMDEEFQIARDLWKNIRPNDEIIDQDFTYYRFPREVDHRDALVVMASMGNMGLTWSGLFASHSIQIWKPANVIQIGIAGSLVGDKLPLGDIIIPDQIVGYHLGEFVEQGTEVKYKFRQNPGQPGFSLMSAARALANDHSARETWAQRAEQASRHENDEGAGWRMRTPVLHIGEKERVASGNFVVKSQIFADGLREIDSQLRAVEMEAMGLFGAIRPLSVPPAALIVRGISDFANTNKEVLDASSRGKFRRAAMRSATQFVLDLIDRRLRNKDEGQISAENLVLNAIVPRSRTEIIEYHRLTPRGKGSRHIVFDPLIKVVDAMTEIISLSVSTARKNLQSAAVELSLRQTSKDWERFLEPRVGNGSWTWKVDRRAEPYTLGLVILTDDPHRTFKITATDEFGRSTTLETEPGP
jgi:nucleoside phosphorylase